MEVQLLRATSVATLTPPSEDNLRRAVMSKPDDAARAVFDFNKYVLAAAMRTLGFSAVVVTYNGGGDEGQIDGISFLPLELAEGSTKAVVALMRYRWDAERRCGGSELVFEEMSLRDIAEALCDSAVSLTGHNGYENGEGGSGTFTLQVADASSELQHSDYYIESDTSMHSL